MTLDAIWTAENGEPAVKKTLRSLYQVYADRGNIDAADFVAAVEVAMAETEWPLEKRREIRQRLESIAQHAVDSETSKLNLDMGLAIIPFNMDEWMP